MKKILLASILLASSSSFAGEGLFCYSEGKVSEEGFSYNKNINIGKSEICIKAKDSEVVLSEYSYIYGENDYVLESMSKEMISKIKSIHNINGKLLLITKDNELYTTNIGYVLNNNSYLPLKNNNKVELVKESVSKVKKVIYSDVMLVLTHDNKVMLKTEEGNWERAPFKSVIDIAYSNYGSYFLLTKQGVFAKLKEKDLQQTGYEGKGSLYKFDKAELGRIPLDDMRFGFIENKNNANYIKLNFKNKRSSSTYDVFLLGNKAYVNDAPSKHITEENETLYKTINVMPSLPIVEAENVSVDNFQQVTNVLNVMERATLKTNKLLTKYDGWVTLPYKENVDLTDSYDHWSKPLKNMNPIVSIKEDIHKKLIYVLRSDGRLKVYNKESLLKVGEDSAVKELKYDHRSESIEAIK